MILIVHVQWLCMLIIALHSASGILSSDLSSNCYNFPKEDFAFDNNVKLTYGTSPKIQLEVGERAIDFTLCDPNVSHLSATARLLVEILSRVKNIRYQNY
jgi:hypothetical protein